jgi:hypothetical protein
MNRPDFSELVVHFTTDREPYAAKKHADKPEIKRIVGTAFEKLVSILRSRSIWATPQNWTNRPAVCFTECPWGSLVHHAGEYSPFGVGFHKQVLFQAGGGPAIYLRPDLREKQMAEFASKSTPPVNGLHPELYAFVTPFMPRYASTKLKSTFTKGKPVDYSHEREWRVPGDFNFQYSEVAFVVVATYEDMAKFPKTLKDAIGRDKFIILEMYKTIEKLWPTHLMPGS